MANQLPPYAALITISVEDVDRWKEGFDAGEPERVAAGMLAHHINRAEDDPNRITTFFALSDLDRARAFATSSDLGDAMRRAGVVGPPEVRWLKPVREAIIWDRQLPAFILNHHVADVDTWLAGYDDAAALQEANGIIGQAANISVDDPTLATVYHQAESFDTLREFLDNADLKAAMEKAGVTSAPEVTFYTGGWAKQY